ncbi:DUF433 domain-containing protein [Thioclava electrotropha]|uniref:DUF433 domain-containing protein n=1 Tax=Thioclava electrotropha TaxID=1549850 RepID=A0ABX6Z023_9RHOB|nr:DUF433 domain-containing protein [Thioclava electrotropha]
MTQPSRPTSHPSLLSAHRESRDEILGGEPLIKGTRITCRSVLGRLSDGDTLDYLCEEHPSIPREAFEGAATYARTHPVGNPPKADLDDDEPEVCPTELQANLLLFGNGKFANRIWHLSLTNDP